jgi:cell division protein FtsW
MHLPLKDNSIGQGLLITTLAMLALGVVTVHSALSTVAAGEPIEWYNRHEVRHTIYAALAAIVMLTLWPIDYRVLLRHTGKALAGAVLVVALLASVVVLMRVPGISHHVGNQYRWLKFGSFQVQPSELLKLALVVFLAAWLGPQRQEKRGPLTWLAALGLIALCAGVVITEDLGTAVLIGLAALMVLILARIPWYYLLALPPVGFGVFWALVMLQPHRLARLDPMMMSDAEIISANVMAEPGLHQPQQALLAICHGGWWGTGLGNGVIKLGYLPADTTDFVFAAFCEEWGLVGAMLLMALVLIWAWLARKAAATAPDRLGVVLAGSLGFIIVLQMVMHIAVASVSLPPTGMSFPFFSYGGTAMVTMAAAVAMMVSVTARRRGDPPPIAVSRRAAREENHVTIS